MIPKGPLVRLLKRDGRSEPFNPCKLRACLHRCLARAGGNVWQAHSLSQAVQSYMMRNRQRLVTSRAVFEMALRSLRAIGQDAAADILESTHLARQRTRRQVRLIDDAGRPVAWDRAWAARQLEQRWGVSPSASRALSGELEAFVLQARREISHRELLDRLDELVDQFGLAPWCLLASVPAK